MLRRLQNSPEGGCHPRHENSRKLTSLVDTRTRLVECNGPDVTVIACTVDVLLADDEDSPERGEIFLQNCLNLLDGCISGDVPRPPKPCTEVPNEAIASHNTRVISRCCSYRGHMLGAYLENFTNKIFVGKVKKSSGTGCPPSVSIFFEELYFCSCHFLPGYSRLQCPPTLS